MRKVLLNYISFICFGLLVVNFACKPKDPVAPKVETANVVYTPTSAIFPNPERGFYKHTEINLVSGTGALTQSQLTNYRQNNIALVYRVFYLKNFKNTHLSQAALDEVNNDFTTARNGGVKLIVRFAYSSSQTESDAPLNIVLQHMEQLKPILAKNIDVIFVLQAGFIGAWGEWYYTSNNLNTSAARYEVIKKLLEIVPQNRYIQLRTPAYKQAYFQRTTPLSYEEAFKETDISRVGHHNDCFLASTTDYGTYNNPTVDKAYLNKECLFVPIGGETCPPDGVNPATSTKAQEEMRYLRWTYLNEDYYHGVNDAWKLDGGMDNIVRELGYRLQLSSGEYSNKVRPGGIFTARLIIKNVGYAPIYNERFAELILKNNQSGERFRLKLTSVEPRFWQPLASNEIEINGGLPQDMPEGTYTLYLNLPDADPAIYDNPAFSIRMANDNVWEESTGYNNLNATIHVSSNNNTENYSGNVIFEKIH
ncbi:MAG: DUF4832 domain-containing protein [Dysgonomonas sp.]